MKKSFALLICALACSVYCLVYSFSANAANIAIVQITKILFIASTVLAWVGFLINAKPAAAAAGTLLAVAAASSGLIGFLVGGMCFLAFAGWKELDNLEKHGTHFVKFLDVLDEAGLYSKPEEDEEDGNEAPEETETPGSDKEPSIETEPEDEEPEEKNGVFSTIEAIIKIVGFVLLAFGGMVLFLVLMKL